MAFARLRGAAKLTLLSCLLLADSASARWDRSKPTGPFPIPELAQDRAPPWIHESGTPDALMDFLSNSNVSEIHTEPGLELILYWNIENLTVPDFFNPWFRAEHGLRDPRVERWWLFQERLAKYRNHPLEKKVGDKWSMTKAAKDANAMVNSAALNQSSTSQVAAATNDTAAPKIANLHRRRILSPEEFFNGLGNFFAGKQNNRVFDKDKHNPPKENKWSFDPMSDRPFEPHCWTDSAPRERFGNFGGAQLCRDVLMVLNKTVWANKPWVKVQCMATYEGVTTAVSVLPDKKKAETTFSGNIALGVDWLTASCPRQRECFDRKCAVGGYISAHGEENMGVVVSNAEKLNVHGGKVKKKDRKKNKKDTFWF